MKETTKATLGLILAVLALVIAVTTPEIRTCLGLEKDEKPTPPKQIIEPKIPTNKTFPKNTDKSIEKGDENSNSSKASNEIIKKPKINSVKKNDNNSNETPKKKTKKIIKPNSAKTIEIFDIKTKEKNIWISSFLQEITEELQINNVSISGNSNSTYSPNKTTKDKLSCKLDLLISVNGSNISLPTLFGRGNDETEALKHTLSHNKNIIKTKIKESI